MLLDCFSGLIEVLHGNEGVQTLNKFFSVPFFSINFVLVCLSFDNRIKIKAGSYSFLTEI